MTAYLVLAAVALLIALLIHGRISPGILFTSLAGLYYFAGLVSQETLLAGYGNPALATLVLLLLVSLALERSPILDRLSDALLKGRPALATLRFTGVTALISAFLNNTAAVGALLGMVCRQKHLPASRLLIPLSYASVLGGITTLVGTSTNLIVNSFVIGAGLPPLAMFTFAPVGVPVALVCLLVLTLSVRLLPAHASNNDDQQQAFFLEAQLAPDSPLVGGTLEANRLRQLDGLYLLEIERGERLISPVGPDEVLEADDVLIFTGETSRVQSLQRFPGLTVFGNRADALLQSNLVEVVVSNQSELANKTLRDVDFRTMFDAGVVGIRRGGKRLRGQLGRIPLRVGDSLLLAVGADFSQHRNIDRNFHILDGSLMPPRLTERQSTLALAGFGLVVALSALQWLPLFTGLLALLAAFLASGLLTLAELRRRFPFELLLIIGSALTVARALEDSGAAAIVAEVIQSTFANHGSIGALIGIYLLTLVLTELVTNSAAAGLAFPIALSTSQALGADPMPFIMVVAFGASACFIMPFGYQTHLMVYSPGRYRLLDFVRVGLPVSVAYSVTAIFLVTCFFPF